MPPSLSTTYDSGIVRQTLLFALAAFSSSTLIAAELTGVVRLPSGEPVARARVTLADASVRETRSGTDGTFTSVILVGTAARTHFMNSGNSRPLELPFMKDGTRVTVTIPREADAAPLGHYMLFVMVDDIPSVAAIVKIEPSRSRFRAVRH